MRKHLFQVCLALLLVSTTRAVTCSSGWTAINNKCIRAFCNFEDWSMFSVAEQKCQSHGANLVTIENDATLATAVRSAIPHTPSLWIGASESDNNVEGDWRWRDGTVVGTFNWWTGRSSRYTRL